MSIFRRKEALNDLQAQVKYAHDRLDRAAKRHSETSRRIAALEVENRDMRRQLNAIGMPELAPMIQKIEAQNLILKLGEAHEAIKGATRIAKDSL